MQLAKCSALIEFYKELPSWRKFQRRIQSEPIRAIRKNVSAPIRKTFWASLDEYRSKINPAWSDLFRCNPKHQSEWIWTKFLIWMNQRLKWFRSNRIENRMNEIKSDWFLTDFHQTGYRTFSRNRSKTDYGMTQIRSDWIPLRNFHQGKKININWVAFE